MTNEEKLLKLIEIAVENGWENYYTEPNTNTIIIRNELVSVKGCDKFSLNDLVLNFEEDGVSFIQGLYRELSKRNISYSNKPGCYVDESFRLDWVLLPTSKRLEFLFETFSHLLC